MKYIKIIVIALFVITTNSLFAQKPYTTKFVSPGYSIIFYNTENLYDTIDDPHCDDSEYLPGAKNKWNAKKYQTKINNISRVLAAVDSVNLPAIIGLAEIENLNVLKDLVSSDALKAGGYKIIHEESSDPRGIDVALLYKPAVFKEISHSKIPVFYKDTLIKSTRECLYICGVIGKKDTIHLIVNHWKSRSGGTAETEPRRIAYAKTIRKLIDSVFAVCPKANILLMGDFNDNPNDSSISKYLNANKLKDKLFPENIYNIAASIADSGLGSLYYKSWDLFDQIMVSTSLLSNKKRGIFTDLNATVFKPDWILYRNSKGVMVPNRTFTSGNYYGGFSDHLPVTVKLYILK